MAENEYILEVKNLCQHFSSGHGKNKMVVKAVDDVSFDVRRAETFGLVGESGCGKTTTGRTIIRLYDPTGGEVLFDGRDISGKMTKDLRSYLTSNISMIFQDPIESLNPKMTIEEIVGEGLKVRGQKDRDEIHRQVVEMLEKVGLVEEHATRYPHEFSGGQAPAHRHSPRDNHQTQACNCRRACFRAGRFRAGAGYKSAERFEGRDGSQHTFHSP